MMLVFTRLAVRTGLLIPHDGALRLSTPHFAKEVHLWVSLILLKLERQVKMKESRDLLLKALISFLLPPSNFLISFLPASQLDVTSGVGKNPCFFQKKPQPNGFYRFFFGILI